MTKDKPAKDPGNAPSLRPVDSGLAPMLSRVPSPRPGRVPDLEPTEWLIERTKKFNAVASYIVEVPVSPTAEMFLADIEAMLTKQIDNGHSSWGFNEECSHWVPRMEPRYLVRELPGWADSFAIAKAFLQAAGDLTGETQQWLEAFPRLAYCSEMAPNEEYVMDNVIKFLGTKPRKAERQELKRRLENWLQGDGPWPREAAWMTKPYDPYKRF